MSSSAKSLRAFLDRAPACALVEVAEAKGSTPREQGAWMLVSPDAIFGTIGGGQMEFLAIDRARRLLAEGMGAEGGRPSPFDDGAAGQPVTLDIPLGPEIGQCCGGRVAVAIRVVNDAGRLDLMAAAEASDAARPHVYVFGGGHVGQALSRAFALLPLRTIVVETRADALDGMPADVETRLTAVPEEMVRAASACSAFVVLTHDHALDFVIVAEALRRDDAAYVGMIGSKTKKATFRSWYLSTAGGTDSGLARLVCPIGGITAKDKRPEVIAALAAAEIIVAVLAERQPKVAVD